MQSQLQCRREAPGSFRRRLVGNDHVLGPHRRRLQGQATRRERLRPSPNMLVLMLGTCSLASALSTQAPLPSAHQRLQQQQQQRSSQNAVLPCVMSLTTERTNMFLPIPSGITNAVATQQQRQRQQPSSSSSVRFTADLHLTPQDLIHSKRYRDRGILGFMVEDFPSEATTTTTTHSCIHNRNANDAASAGELLSSSSLHASSRGSSNADATSDAPWQHIGDDENGEDGEVTWTSMSSWSSRRHRRRDKQRPLSRYSVWKNNNSNNNDSSWIPSASLIGNMNVAQLKATLAARGLPNNGSKQELCERLEGWATSQRELPRPREPGFSLTNMYQTYGVPPRTPSFLSKPGKLLDETGPPEDDWVSSSYEDDDEGWPMNDGEKTLGMLKANSLAEWSRTVDLEPLFQRREAIHREKQVGKPAKKRQRKNARGRKGSEKQQQSTIITKDDYISVLKKVFDDSSSSKYSNYEVKQIYAAAKEADQMGDRALSKRILMELKEATPHDMRIYRRLSRMEKEDGNISGARSILQEGLRLDSENAFLWHGLAQVAPSDHEAKKYYRKAIEFNPSLPMPHHALGTLEHTQGRIAAAMKTLKKGLEYCPTNHRLHHALGDLYREAKMLQMAEKCYRKALKYGPSVSHGFAYSSLASVAYEDGKPGQCRAWLRKAVELNEGRHANSWVSWAHMEEAEGNIAAARTICMAGIAKYERGLLKRANVKSTKGPVPSLGSGADKTATAIRNKLMAQVPTYRSGDRFFQLYRAWARLEESHGTSESVEEVHRRAFLAFPTEWKLTIDWAEHYCQLNMYERASELYAVACAQSSGQHGDPYRFYAEYEMSRGNYEKAQKILFRGAVALSQTAGAGLNDRNGMAELYYVWAVCEWHLENLERAENLFDQALQLTTLSEESSQTRCLIFFAMAQLQHYQDEPLLAQHCIGLCLKENRMPGGTSKVWELWAAVADEMENDHLSSHCSKLAEKSRAQEESDQPQLLALLSPTSVKSRPSMQQLMRRDPWKYKLFGGTAPQRSASFHSVRLPATAGVGEEM